jgi:hypothetical protein
MSTLPFTAIDKDCPLVPEQLPWLAHTNYWQSFSLAEKLRANQLMGLLINELCLALERGLVLGGLRQALSTPALHQRPELQQQLMNMLADERRHAAWFAAYNHAFAPEIYGENGFRFVNIQLPYQQLVAQSASFPGAWRLATWLAMATEEWACALAESLKHEPAGELGKRDIGFYRLHHAHREEERSHLALDAELLTAAAQGLPRPVRRGVVGLARFGLAQLMKPRRAAPAMLSYFVSEFPRWQEELPGLIKAVAQVGATPKYWRSRGVAVNLTATTACAAAWGMSWQRPAEVTGD